MQRQSGRRAAPIARRWRTWPSSASTAPSKSIQRERRPFTDQDDQKILECFNIYGPAWTKIQRDPRFNLSSRQPTDLRDRVRNKYPTVYQRIEKGTFQAKDQSRGNDTLEPLVNMSIDDSLKRSKTTAGSSRTCHGSSREELHPWPMLQVMDPSSYAHPPQTLEFSEASAPHSLAERWTSRDCCLIQESLRRLHDTGWRGVSDPSSPSGLAAEHQRERHGTHIVKC